MGTLIMIPAAFRRLCVETIQDMHVWLKWPPAAFRRLCVETDDLTITYSPKYPAAFRRLCVETKVPDYVAELETPSRLQAAVC